MRATKRFERRITTPYYKIGTLKRVEGEGTVTLSNNAPIVPNNLVIRGNTTVTVTDFAKDYSSYFENENSYVSAGVNGAYAIPLPESIVGRELVFSLSSKSKVSGAPLYLADGSSLLHSSLTLLCDKNGNSYTVKGSGFTHLIFMNVITSDKEMDDGSIVLVRDGIVNFWEAHDLSITSEPSPAFPATLTYMGNVTSRIIFNCNGKSRTISLPKTISVNEETIPLRFTAYDEIVIDRKSRSVIYREGSFIVNLTGTEIWQISEGAAAQGKGIYSYVTLPIEVAEGVCDSLTYMPWTPSLSCQNVFSIFGGKNLAIRLSGYESSPEYFAQALSRLKSLLKEKYNAGKGISIILRRKKAIEHDLSSTGFATSLLALSVPKRGSESTITFRSSDIFGYVKAEYYAQEEGNNATLTVVSKDESGKEISSPIEYTLRIGSAYKLNAPEIDGYEPCEPTLFGAITENKTVVIEYKEKK